MKRWLIALAGGFFALSAAAQERALVLASTTSTQDSGLFGHILPKFTARTGIAVKVIAQGSGQALDTARRGDADVVLVHARAQEEKFVAEGYGVKRHPVMYNDFVLVGPEGPRGRDIVGALRGIAAEGATFISRGDRSGTHQAELALWRLAGLEPAASKPAWYREIGQGMGAALNMAAALNAYTLSDRATWTAFRNRRGLVVRVEGDNRLFNQYGVILVNPARHPHVKAALGQRFIDWLVSAEGQSAVASYRVGGEQLFFPNADRPDA